MEGDTLSNNLKDHSVGSGARTRSHIRNINNYTCGNNDNICSNNHHQSMLRSPWNYSTQQVYRQNSILGLSWPPRSYSCSFCKREFRSAQALGGHMNVHRRDRARLSQSSPSPDGIHLLNLNPNSNHNPKDIFLPSLPSPHSIFPHPLSSLSLLPASSSSTAIEQNPMQVHKPRSATNPHVGLDLRNAFVPNSVHTNEELGHCKRDDGLMLRSGSDTNRFGLKMGMLNDFKEELDLELRLGCL